MTIFRISLLIFELIPLLVGAQEVNTVDFPVEYESDSTIDCAVILNKIISEEKTPLFISFEEGDYFFRSTVKLKSNVVIQGSKSKRTNFVFDLNGKNDLITLKGSLIEGKIKVQKTIKSNSFEIKVANAKRFEIGMMVRVYKNEPIIKLSDWASNSIGQLLEINQVTDSSIIFSRAVKIDYLLTENPLVEIIKPIENVKISNLVIERKDQTIYQTSNVSVAYARNCELTSILSVMTNFAHVSVDYSMNVRIEKFDAYNSFSHGNGGKGYGVTLQYSSTDCLVQDCVFRKLRHAIVMQSGANGNLVHANYALEGFWEDVHLPKFAAGDIVLHGNYPYHNYIEGNVCNQIVVDKSHGLNGFNLILRNRLLKYGVFVQSRSTDLLIVHQNDIVKTKFLEGKIRGKRKNLDLNLNRRNNNEYKRQNSRGVLYKTESNEGKSMYTIGHPSEFKNFYNAAYFRYNSSLISTFN